MFPTAFFLLSLLLMSANPGWCQGSLGGLTGRVVDSSGAPVPGVTVTIRNVDTGVELKATSTSGGEYLAPSLQPGRYRVSTAHPGFKTVVREPVQVSTATTSNLDFTLVVGDVTESVTVAGGGAQLETTSAEIGTVMQTKTILDLPISLGGAATTGATGRRQIENFIFLTPGVTGTQWSKSINGAPGFSAEILIDGIDMQNIGAPGFIAEASPPYEAVEEFKVQNTMYPAEYGGGYGVLNFTLRSGTNKFHGDLFEFVRNDKFDARSFFTGSKKPMLRQNEFGGTFGGPVVLPKYNGRDRTFFNFAYSGFRLRGGVPTGALVSLPTALQRDGNFADYPFPIFDPASTRPDGNGGSTRDQFPNNQIPKSRFSAVATRTLPLIPLPDSSGYFNNYVNRANQPSKDDDWSLKIDHQFNSKRRISGAYWGVRGNTQINGAVAGELNPGFRDTPTVASGYRLNYTDTISATVLNRIGFGYTPTSPTWSRWTLDPRQGNKTLQIPGIPADSHGYPIFNFAGPTAYASLGNSNNNGTDPQFFQNWSVSDDVSWVKGNHQLKFGFMYRRRKMTVLDRRNEGGTFNFNSLSTSQPNSPDFAKNGNGFASFLLGQVYSANAAVPAPLRHFSDNFMAAYAEDIIKLTPRLNLSIGLRYELPMYATEADGLISFLDLSRPNPGAGGRPGALVFLGNGDGRTGTDNIFGSYHKAFSPRIALADSANSKTVIRLGYGIFRIQTSVGRLNGCNY
ncbi:MAG: carboxypeptidase-like regulatory domain-containing protein, partial [Bryobacteraceae bacterium]